MSAFDPYHKWLGIPKAEQPPHHYRLLGIAPFEADPEVIEAAADRQMAYIRQCATGPYTKESQQILNELSAARVCLLNAEKKQAYDSGLKSRLAAAAVPPQSSTAISRPRVTRIPAARRPPLEEAEEDEYPLIVVQQPVAEPGLILPRRRGPKKRPAGTIPNWFWGGAGLLVLGCIIYAVVAPGGRPEQFADQTAAGEGTAPPVVARQPATTPADDQRRPERSKKPRDVADGKPPEAPLAAANSPAVDDLLKRIALKPNMVRGTWRFDGTTLVSPETNFALLQIPVTPPDSYTLRATIETNAIRDCLCLGLVTGNSQVTAVCNGWQGTTSGLQLVNYQLVPTNETRTGPVLLAGRPNEIVCTVTRGRIEITCNGKPFVKWSGDFNRLMAGPDWEPPDKRQLYLGTHLTTYRITRLELERLAESR